MSWIQNLAHVVKQVLTLEERVKKNTEEIKELRQDLKELLDFTRKIAYAVQRNQDRAEDKYENLSLLLENKLLEFEKQFERRLNVSNQSLSQNHIMNDGNEAYPALIPPQKEHKQ